MCFMKSPSMPAMQPAPMQPRTPDPVKGGTDMTNAALANGTILTTPQGVSQSSLNVAGNTLLGR